jgi:hypothetical protein
MGEQPVENKTKEELITIVDHLLKEIDILQEENESLWFMLEEIHESDKAAKKLTDEQREKAVIEFLTKMEPVGDA